MDDSIDHHQDFPRDNIIRTRKDSEFRYKLLIWMPISASCPDVITADDASFQLRLYWYSKSSSLKDFVEWIVKDAPFVHSINVFSHRKLVPLLENLLTLLQKGHVVVRLNDKWKYKVDYSNVKNRKGNDLFKEKQYVKAIRCYNASVARWPRQMKPLSNRALSFLRLDTIDGYMNCIRDCELYLEFLHENQHVMEESDCDLETKVRARRVKGVYLLAKMLFEYEGRAASKVVTEKQTVALERFLAKHFPKISQNQPTFTFGDKSARYIAVQLLHVACRGFSVNKRLNASEDFEKALNLLVTEGEVPLLCPMCRKETDDMVKRHALPEEMWATLSEMRKSDNHKKHDLWNVLDRELYLLCHQCNDRISTFEKKFCDTIWTPLHKYPTRELKLKGYSSEWLTSFVSGLTWMIMCANGLNAINLTDKDISSVFSRLRTHAAGEPRTSSMKQYIFTESTTVAGIDKNLQQYLEYSAVRHDYETKNGALQFVHTKLSYLHFVSFFSTLRYEWPGENDVARQASFFIPADQRRTFPNVLLRFLRKRGELTPITRDSEMEIDTNERE